MPRKIKPEIACLLGDRDWLYEQHVNQLFSISELARNLGVTPSVIRNALRGFDIQSPSQQRLREASNKRKYGVPNPGMIDKFRKKALDTMTKKYGGHVWSNNGKRNERDATCLLKYGNVNVAKTEHSRNKSIKTNTERYNRQHPNQLHINDASYEKINDIQWIKLQHYQYKRSLSDIAEECNVDMSILMNRLRKYGLSTKHFFHSAAEKDIAKYTKTILPNTIINENVRNVVNCELDIYIPSHNLAIEYCGLYWHSTKFKRNNYHRDKLRQCQEQGIRLLTIFEDEWFEKPEIVKNKIAIVCGVLKQDTVYARNCDIVNVSQKLRKEFLTQHHIQGDGPGSITYGLTLQNKLVALATFINQGSNFVLNRYATSCNVPGGFSRLVKHFERNHDYDSLISFADLRWSNGELYNKNGWTLDKELRPDYYWCKNGKRYHKFQFRHKFLTSKLQNYDSALSETANCENNGFYKIYNCGLLRYIKQKDNV